MDWGEKVNHLAVVDAAGAVVAHTTFVEDPEGIKAVLDTLRGLSGSHRHSRLDVPVAIETGHGLTIAALRQARQPLVVVNPTVAATYRGRAGVGRRKADRTDAALLASQLRTDGHLHRLTFSPTPQAQAITVLSRQHLALAGTRRTQLNRLRSHLRLYFPAALQAWQDLPDGIGRAEARAVLAVAPTPELAKRLTYQRLLELVVAGRTRQPHLHADRVHTVFQEAQLRQPAPVEQAMGAATRALLAQVTSTTTILDALTLELLEAFRGHPHAPIYCSFPGAGELTGARLLGEIGDDPARFRTARGLCAYAGASPVTWSSGESHTVTHRKIANRILKGTCWMWAFAALSASPGARSYYDRRREAGDRHGTALRKLQGRLLRGLHHCLSTGEHYQERVAFPPPAPEPEPAAPVLVSEPDQGPDTSTAAPVNAP
ncbi:IS110 family RNA-guided transposase [Actinomadura harenae]|uniref:IS110 family transposase n=1 Tax=Actinomadura harenae TaxID=2483351 RepID=UPI0013151DDD|nr:IS110 family transposase [Actinomadura harenae]